MILAHFLHYFYAPTTGPWYAGAVWGNVFVLAVLAPLGWLWARTKFWPLQPVRAALSHLHEKVDAHRTETRALHGKVDRLHARHDEHVQALASLHAKLDQREQR